MDRLPVILASSSQRRIDILSSLGWKYECISPDIDETPWEEEIADQLVVRLSIGKAQVVADSNPGCIIIAADSVVEVDGRVYGKPNSPSEAEAMLKEIRGTDHRIHSGITVINSATGNVRSHCVTTKVHARNYTDVEIRESIDRGTPFDKAGGYAIQDSCLNPVKILEGCYSGSLGLPVCKLIEIMVDMGQDIQNTNFVQDSACKPFCVYERGNK